MALFPTGDYHELALGSYNHQLASDSSAPIVGLDLRYRRVFDTDNPDVTPTGETARLRLYRDADGQTHIDQLELESLLASFRIRPELGDKLDVGLLFGTWDEIWSHRDSGRAQWRIHTPLTLTALGLANNDMDDDDRIKWYGAVGLGVGGDWIRRMRGPVGIQARADTGFHSRVRWNPGDPATTRHEWASSAELGLSWLRSHQSLALTGWAETIIQWDPRDAEGRDGIDRRYMAAGLAVSGRLYQGRQAQAEPDMALLTQQLEVVALQAELDALLPEVVAAPQEPTSTGRFKAGRSESPPQELAETPPVHVIQGPVADPGILTVHWSELALRFQAPVVADLPANTPRCTLRFLLDAEGVPTEVLPASCPEQVLETATAAGLRWRFEPFLDGGRAIPVQVVFAIPFESPP
jgi:hypothetical protein